MIYYDDNGEPVIPDVRFGPKDHQVMRLDRAEVLLSWLFESRPHVFRDGMCQAYDLPSVPEKAPRAPRKPKGE